MQCNSSLSCNCRFCKSSPWACHEDIWTNRCLALLILIFGTRWSPVVSCTLRSLYSRERAPGTLDAPRSGRYVLNIINLLTLTAIEPRPAGSPSGSPVTILTAIPPPKGSQQWQMLKEFTRQNLSPRTAARAQTRSRLPSRQKRAKFLLYVESNRTSSDNALWVVTSQVPDWTASRPGKP